MEETTEATKIRVSHRSFQAAQARPEKPLKQSEEILVLKAKVEALYEVIKIMSGKLK
jgi:hypothetical protein